MPPKKRIYCGESDDLPKGYSRFGSRFECLKKGYGSALIYSTEEQRRNATKKMMERPPSALSKDQLEGIAARLSVPTSTDGGKKKTKNDLIDDLLKRLKNLKK